MFRFFRWLFTRKTDVLAQWAICGGAVTISLVGYGYVITQFRIRDSDYSKEAVLALRSNRMISSLLGEPINIGFVKMFEGNIVENDNINVHVPVKGSLTKGTLFYEAKKEGDVWKVSSIEFQFNDKAGGRVVLKKSRSENREEVCNSETGSNVQSENNFA